MAWGVYQVEEIILAFILVQHATSLCLDGDATLALHVELVQKLLLASRFDCAGELEEPVAEGALAMVDMGDNAKISEAVKGYLGYPLFKAPDSL